MNGFSPFNYEGEGFVQVVDSLDSPTLTRKSCSVLAEMPVSSINRSASTTNWEKLWFDVSKPSSFWSIVIFINQLANLPGQIRIQDGFDLLGLRGAGHSV
ncbi:hypothetical protein ARMGADRAFT_1086514 [Armillaria gallica]|uniref:Uncharacterized protein n=1 Tax=Armillaria gallica TaxID=47427 RepID=A0A2H3CTH8_ARMGA|nr:hypothetical protein ARMGADRAFT_1086514 [Armillaria gallica]